MASYYFWYLDKLQARLSTGVTNFCKSNSHEFNLVTNGNFDI